MRFKQQKYYLLYGIRQRAQLLKPRMTPMGKFNLPLDSIYQYMRDNGAIIGPSPQDRIFNTEGGRLFIEHVTKLAGHEGNPRRTVVNPITLEADFRRVNRVFRPLRKDESLLINSKNMLVINYNVLNPLWKYIASYKANYYRWHNNNATLWQGVADAHERFKWNQYIEFEIPTTLPPRSKWDNLSGSINQSNLELFPTTSHLSAHDLYRWIGPDRESSMLNTIPKEAYPYINLLFRLRTHFFVLNLGVMDSWRKEKVKGADGVESINNPTGIEASQLQVQFLHLLRGALAFSNEGGELNEDADGLYLDLLPAKATATTSIKEKTVIDDATPIPTEVEEDEEASELVGETPVVKEDSLDLFGDLDMDTFELPTAAISVPAVGDDLVDNTVDDDDDSDPIGQTLSDITDDDTDEPMDSFADQLLADPNVSPIALKSYEMAETGVITHRAMNRAIEDALTFKQLPDPYNSGQTLEEAMILPEGATELPPSKNFIDKSTVLDKSMLSSKLKQANKKYVQEVMHKDILQAVVAIQKQGVAVKDYKVEVVRDAMNHYEIHAVTIKPIRGRQTTVRFRIPVVDKDGRFVSNGVTYRMKWQRGDIPLRKINDFRVAMTSYYNKIFVDRSKRRTDDFERWLLAAIKAASMDAQDTSVTDIRLGYAFAEETHLPRMYTLVSKQITEFNSGEYHFYFDWKHRAEHFATKFKLNVEQEETAGQVLMGVFNKQAICMDSSSVLYLNTKDGQEPLGTLTDVIGLDMTKAPDEVAEMSIQNKIVPVGIALAYYFGLSTLLKELGVEHSRHARGERLKLTADSYTLVFQDEVIVLSRTDSRATLILNGLNRYHRTLKKFSVWDFDKKDVYYRLLEEAGLGVRYLRELDSLKAAWIDPITEGLLIQMGEPVEFSKLLVRAVELLMTDYCPKETDPKYMRYRGYERFAGVIYGELARSVKTFNNRASVGETGVEMNPYAVWQKLVQDPSVGIIEESNPIANLREQEGFTYRGDGGRSSVSMVERTRVMHDDDDGTVSEATVDSGEVGVIAYLSPDANIINLRGVTKPKEATDGPSKRVSSSALISPCAEHDDIKRIGFISVQHQQGIFADGYDLTPMRTGYETVVAQRTTSAFATTAEQAGVVESISKHAIKVRYADGTFDTVPLGLYHGIAAGHTYPHTLKTDLKVGQAFNEGDTLSYNSKYFKPDRYTPGQVSWMSGVLCNVAFMEKITTLEDGCEISEDIAKKFNTQSTEIRNVVIEFTQNLNNLVNVGDHVDLETILCTIEDPELANNPLFDDAALDTLRRVEAKSPRAKVVGTVSKIEVYYHGDFEDMSEGLQAIARRSDKERKDVADARGEPAFTGEVDFSFRIKGEPIDPDHVAIRIFIDHDVSAGLGDKGVVANQMKTIISGIFKGENTLESGEPLHLKFANTSVEERMVLSPKLIATTNMLLHSLSKHASNVYRGNTNARAKR